MAVLPFNPALMVKLLEEGIDKQLTTISIQFIVTVVPLTPVDTGLARGGWQVSAGTPPNQPTGRLDPSGQSTISQAIADLNRIGKKGQEKWYISNLTDHIGILNSEATPSNQAPPGFIEFSLNGAIEQVTGVRVTL